ncbi:MAG: TonB-dependent receptor [Tannerellaceae bacterium]
MRTYFVTVLLSIIFLPTLYAQHSFSGKISNLKREPLDMAQVVLAVNDSIHAAGFTNEKGEFAFKNLPLGDYILQISAFGYAPLQENYSINRDIKANFSLVPSEVQLQEVLVTADQSQLVKRTATGEIFYLSKEAKSKGDPFMALKEIPKLRVNDVAQSISMADGSQPLILIDGIAVNSGVAPIDPADIESVEVMDIVTARYAKKGIRNIINIKVKRKTAPYLFFQTATRHDIPLRNGFGVVYSEVGNQKFSIYGRTSINYTYHDATDIYESQQGENYTKETSKENRKDGNNYFLDLLLKWRPGQKDYLIGALYAKKNNYKSRNHGTGVYTTEAPNPFILHSDGRNNSYIATGSLFHQHRFTEDKILETTLAFNGNGDKNQNELTEDYNEWLYEDFFKYKSNRKSGSLDINYSWNWDVNSLNIGNSTNYLNDKIDKVSENNPVFHHNRWDQYLYADFNSKIKKLYYMASVGVEGIWTKSAGFSNSYVKPRVSVSGTYTINNNNSFRLGYTLSNEAPPVGQLNPYNTSVDSLVVIKGNPMLLPAQNHVLNGSYTFNKWGFYFSPSATYTMYTDKIEAFGYSENDIFIKTYKNLGRSERLAVGGSLNYNIAYKNISGSANVNAFHHVDYFDGLSPKKNFSWGAGLYLDYKKWSFITEMSQSNYTYTPISRIKEVTPYTHFQLTYKFTNLFYISAALSNGIGKSKSDAFTYSEQYNAYSRQSRRCYPWILVRYTLRKNLKKKIGINKVINSKESGISL